MREKKKQDAPKKKYKKGGAMPGSGRPKKEGRERITILLEKEISEAFSAAAAESRMTRPDWLNKILGEYFYPNKKQGEKSMKAVINGKKYDTTTAEAITSWGNGCGAGDFNRIDETLYKKKTGEFFMFGEGGARSRYAESYDGGRSFGSGEKIIPLSDQEAREWMEAHATTDEYERVFGAVEE